MKKLKKSLSLLLSLIMILTMIPFSTISSYALDAKDPVKIEIVPSKVSYSLTEVAKITVKVTNQSGKDLENVVISASSGKHLVANGTNPNKEISKFAKNATETYSFDMVLSRKTSGANFFSRLILLLAQLFKSYKEFPIVSYSDKPCVCEEASFKHGSINASVNVNVWYNVVPLTVEEEIERMKDVDDEVHGIMNQPYFNGLSDTNQAWEVMETLRDFENKGQVTYNSISYDSESECISFLYSSGALGGIYLNELSDEFNSINTIEQNKGSIEVQSADDTVNMIESNGNSVADALVLFSFNFPSDSASFRRPFYNNLQDEWNSKGINTTLDTSVTVSDLKNIGANYEIVCFCGHGSVMSNSPILCLTETANSSKDSLYLDDLLNNRISRVMYLNDNNTYYAAFPSLFSNSYSTSGLKGKFIFSESCCFLGEYGTYNYLFSNALLDRGAKAIYGFHNSVYAEYSRDSMKYWAELLLQGKTAKGAFDKVTEKYGKNDEEWYRSVCYKPSGRSSYEYAVANFIGDETAQLVSPTAKYTVSVKSGTGIASVNGGGSYVPGSTVTVKATLSSGYTWDKWTSSNTSLLGNSTSQTYTFTMPKGNVTLTANAVSTKYTVSTVAGTGISSVSGSGSYAPGSTVTVKATLSSGYTWDKWTSSNTSLLGNSTSQTYTFTMPKGNVTLTANAVTTKYTVSVKSGTGISSVSGGGSYAPGSTVTVKATLLSGYTWDKWTSSNTSLLGNSTSQTYTFTMPKGNVTLTASAKTSTYKLHYDANGGTGAPSDQTGATTYTISSTRPTRIGYNFLGWSKNNTATSSSYQPNGSITLTSDTTLYAVWGQTSISSGSTVSTTIGYGGQIYWYKFTPSSSGTYVMYSTGSDDTYGYLYNTSGTEITSNDDSDGSANRNFRVEYNLTSGTTYYYGIKYYNSSTTGTVSVKFGPVYTISYNANGGSGAPSSQKKDWGKSITLSSSTPTYTGRSFAGWSTSSGSTTVSYRPGDTYSSDSNVTLYAVWNVNKYKLHYDANGGTGAPSDQTGATTYTISSTRPTRIGYNFLGWSKSSSATSASYQPNGSITLTSDTTLYAVWGQTSISSGSTVSATIGYGGQIYWYKFTPSSSGTYVIYSTGSDDTYGYLYNTSGTQITSNDDSDGRNFRLEYNLTGGTTYYYGVKYYNSSATGIISVKLGPVYTISYNANGGSGAPSSQKKDWGKNISLSTSKPAYTGHSFLGWSTSSSASNASYQSGGTYSSNSNVTLYAVWSTIKATSISLSSSSKSLTVTDTGIKFSDCPSTVRVPNGIEFTVTHTWNYPTYTFTATVGPDNAYNPSVTVTSSDTSVVKVVSTSRSGNVTTITVQAQDIDYNATKTANIIVKLNDNTSVQKTCSISVYRPHSLNITSSNENVVKTYGGWTMPYAVGTNGSSSSQVTITVTTYQGNKVSKTITVYPPQTFYTVKNSDYNGYAVRSTPGGSKVGGVNNYLTLPVTKCQYIDGVTYGYVSYNNSTEGWGTGYGWISMYWW